MGKDLDGKTIILIIVIVALVGAAGYLTYLISNNENPLVLLNSRASEGDADPLLAQAGTPTPTVAFTSTSPTPTRVAGTSMTPQPSGTVTPRLTTTVTPTSSLSTTPTPSALPSTGGGGAIYVTATPTRVGSLPVAGFGDFLKPAVIGGGILVVVALLL